jgi:hypothetical protein
MHVFIFDWSTNAFVGELIMTELAQPPVNKLAST